MCIHMRMKYGMVQRESNDVHMGIFLDQACPLPLSPGLRSPPRPSLGQRVEVFLWIHPPYDPGQLDNACYRGPGSDGE